MLIEPWQVVVEGSYAYITRDSTPYDIQILDISTPGSPTAVDQIAGIYGTVTMDISGFYLYLTDNKNALQIFDISDPT